MTLVEGIDVDELNPVLALSMLRRLVVDAFQAGLSIAPLVLDAVERSTRILPEAISVTKNLEPRVRQQATALIQRLDEIIKHDPSLAAVGPPVVSQEGAPFSLQWHLPDRRLTFAIECEEEESGWHFVSKKSAGGLMAYGGLPGDLTAAPLELFLKRIR
jgi:hypothetical protein